MTILIHDRATAARALALDLDPPLRAALEAELALLTSGDHDLTDWTDILIVQPGDTEATIAREAGFSPLVEPVDGARFDQPGFEPGWDLLTLRGGVFRIVFTFASVRQRLPGVYRCETSGKDGSTRLKRVGKRIVERSLPLV